MEKCFCVDSMAPNAASQIRDYLLIKLKAPIIEKRPIIFLCIAKGKTMFGRMYTRSFLIYSNVFRLM